MEYIKNNKKSRIFVFEGIDNVGKTTIIKKLKSEISTKTKYNCFDIAFPGKEINTLGHLVYDIHHHQEKYFNEPINSTSLQLLHVASHIDLLQRRIKPLSNNNDIILLDRFWWSTYVYGLADNIRKDVIETIIAPELKYWEEIKINSIFLIEREKREQVYEKSKDEFIRNQYRELALEDSECIEIYNNDELISAVDKIYNIILESS